MEWEDFRREFLDAFPDMNDFGEIHEKLLRRKRKPTEDLEDYIYDVQHMGKMVNMKDEQIRKYILSGLENQELRGMVSMSQCSTIPELLRELRTGESVLRDVKRRRDFGSHSTAPSPKRRKMENAASQSSGRNTKDDERDEESSKGRSTRSSSPECEITSSKKKSKLSSPSKKSPICYFCNKLGHLARNCPSKTERKSEK